MQTYNYNIGGDRAQLSELLHEMRDVLATQNSVPQRVTNHIIWAVDELLTNTISYGYEEDSSSLESAAIRIVLEVSDSNIKLTLEDNAVAFDPFLEVPEPDLESSLEDMAPGGLGVHLVREMMDETSYERLASGNRITLCKQLKLE